MEIINKLSANNIQLLKLFDEREFITRKTQKVYNSRLGYYINIWFFRDEGWIICNGTTSTKEKKWELTNKGKKLVYLLKEIDKV